MAKYILTYFGQPQFETAEEAKEHQGLWMQWAADLGDAVVDPGTPAKPGKVVTKDGVTDTDETAFTGFTMVEADSLEQAVDYAQSCPFVTDGGTMTVHEAVEMSM